MSVNQQNIPQVVNGDQVIKYTSAKELRSMKGYQDLSSLYAWYRDDPNKNHKGLMSLWGKQAKASYPSLYRDLINNNAVMEVNGWDGSFTYELPIEEAKGCYTTRDTSKLHGSYPGTDEAEFTIILNRQYAVGDVLTYDEYDGQQLVVVKQPTPLSEGYEHTVQLNDNDKETWFNPSFLEKGISYFKIGHGASEFNPEFSTVQFPDMVPTMKCEFQLGSIRGVEASITGAADSKNLAGGVASAKQFHNKLLSEAEQKGEFAVIGDYKVGSDRSPRNLRIGATMELLVHRELEHITSKAILFQNSGTIRNKNGTLTRFNEGLWPQLRRGTIIKYGRPGGITLKHIKEAVDYVFRANPLLQDVNKRVKFKCGRYSYLNVLELFSEEINHQNAGLASKGLLGTDRVLPKSPVSGSDLMNLKYDAVRFTEVFIPGIGHLEIEEDPALNMNMNADRLSKGMHGDNFGHTAYSMVIWDVDDQQYSNNKELPKGATLMEGANPNSNIYLVKPEGEHTYWGSRNGRYNITKAGDIVASSKEIAQEFWAYNSVAVWVRDITRFVMIELDSAARKGFN